MLRYLYLMFFAGVVSMPVQATKIVASIKPIQLIAYDIAYGVSEPELLVSATASPHTYALKPSDIKKITSADLVIWFGPELESFLTKAIKKSANTLELSAARGMLLREFGEQDSHEGHNHAEHGHEGHNHGTYDPHFWLGPEQAEHAAKIIAEKLSQVDPDNATKYKANYTWFKQKLAQKTEAIRTQLKPIQNEGYYVFHDAYGYFEEYFGLNNIGHFTVSPDRKPGAKTLIHIRSELKEGKAKCVFAEPQFKPTIIETVVRGSQVSTGKLDPLGIGGKAERGGYFHFLQAIADGYSECLSR